MLVTTFFAAAGRPPHPAHVRRFDVRSGRQLGRVLRVGRPDTVAPVVGARRDRLVLTGTAENATYVVDTATLRVRQRLPSGAFTAGLSLDGRRAALGGEDGSVTLLDLRTGKRRRLADRHDGRVQELAFSADGRTLATVGDDGRGLAWDLRRGSVRETLTGHSGRVTHVNVSDDGRTLYTTGFDSRIIVWDIAGDRRLAQPFPGGNPLGEGLVPALAVSPDGRRLAAGLRGGGVRLRDARTLRLQGELPGIEGDVVLAVEFSPDGRTMAVTGSGGSVELRDASSGRRIRPPLPGARSGFGAPGASELGPPARERRAGPGLLPGRRPARRRGSPGQRPAARPEERPRARRTATPDGGDQPVVQPRRQAPRDRARQPRHRAARRPLASGRRTPEQRRRRGRGPRRFGSHPMAGCSPSPPSWATRSCGTSRAAAAPADA